MTENILQWETIEQDTDHGGQLCTQRARVTGGWLVRTFVTFETTIGDDWDGHTDTNTSVSICFMPYSKGNGQRFEMKGGELSPKSDPWA